MKFKFFHKYPPNEVIYAKLEEWAEKGIGDKPRERPVDLLFNNYGMGYKLAVEYQKEFYERQKLKRSEK